MTKMNWNKARYRPETEPIEGSKRKRKSKWYDRVPANYYNATPKQVSYAKSLGIDPTGHDKKTLSKAIDAALKLKK